MDHTVMPKVPPDAEGHGLSTPEKKPRGVEQLPIEEGNVLVDGARVPPPKDVERVSEDEPAKTGLNL